MPLSRKAYVLITYHVVSLIIVFAFYHENHLAGNMCGPSADLLAGALVFLTDVILTLIFILLAIKSKPNRPLLIINAIGVALLIGIFALA